MSQRDSKGRFVKAEPRAFQVGDEVVKAVDDGCIPKGTRGRVSKVTDEGGLSVYVQWPDTTFQYGPLDPLSWIKLITSAPQPKAEEGQMPPNPYGLPITSIHKAQDGEVMGVCYGDIPTLIHPEELFAKDAEIAILKAEVEDIRHRYDAFLTRMEQIFPEAGDRTELLGCAEAAKAEIASISSEITSLKAEVEDARLEAACERERAEAAKRDARACAQERDEAEAKLDDIKALSRANTIMAAMPGEPTFGEAIEHVIGGAA